jgi:hypothetical protein
MAMLFAAGAALNFGAMYGSVAGTFCLCVSGVCLIVFDSICEALKK